MSCPKRSLSKHFLTMHKPGTVRGAPDVSRAHSGATWASESGQPGNPFCGLRSISCSCECHPPEFGGHISVEPEDEFSGNPRDVGGWDEDVAALLEAHAQEHAAGVGVGRRGHSLLHRELVQPVPPVVLHLQQRGVNASRDCGQGSPWAPHSFSQP